MAEPAQARVLSVEAAGAPKPVGGITVADNSNTQLALLALWVARRHGIPVYRTIAQALCRGGTDLAVDAVLSIGEHGDYPRSALGQVEYPRKRFFDECVAVMRRAGRYVPLYNDKHLS